MRTALTAYDRDVAHRFWRVLLRSHEVLSQFRTAFLGKVKPGALLLGQLRPCGDALFRPHARRAIPGGVPQLPDAVAREAYSHEVSSAGFWPGGGLIDEPAFYSYAYPAPDGFATASVRPAQAFFSICCLILYLKPDPPERGIKLPPIMVRGGAAYNCRKLRLLS